MNILLNISVLKRWNDQIPSGAKEMFFLTLNLLKEKLDWNTKVHEVQSTELLVKTHENMLSLYFSCLFHFSHKYTSFTRGICVFVFDWLSPVYGLLGIHTEFPAKNTKKFFKSNKKDYILAFTSDHIFAYQTLTFCRLEGYL